jgi:hypothetical protein
MWNEVEDEAIKRRKVEEEKKKNPENVFEPEK